MKLLDVAVIGLGFIGEIHARIFAEHPCARLKLVVDKDASLAKKLGERFNCAYATSLTEGMSLSPVSAVSICTPDRFHLENVREAANFGLDILLEKPIAETIIESEEIVDICEKAGVRLMIGHLLHFDPRYAILREAIHNGRFGEIIHMYFRRTNPRANAHRLNGDVSIMYFIGVHDFEMMCSYMRSTPVRVYAQKVSKVNREISAEDTVVATITFENGAIGLVELCWALPNNTSLGINTYAEVVGSDSVGYIEIRDQGLSITTESDVTYPDILHWPEYNEKIQGDLKEELDHFIVSVLENKPFVTKVHTAIQAVQIIEACFESIESNMPITL